MERRLLRAIMTPAMVASWVLGLALLWLLGLGALQEGWLLSKLGLVTVLTAVHGVLARHLKAFAQNRNTWPERYFRILNEVPTLLMIAIVVLVIVRPFQRDDPQGGSAVPRANGINLIQIKVPRQSLTETANTCIGRGWV